MPPVVLVCVEHVLGTTVPPHETGPARLRPLVAGALAAAGVACRSVRVEAEGAPGAAIERVAREVAHHARAAAARGEFVLVLAGNCSTALGALAALGEPPGAVWIDAHGDFNTPETSASGLLDGMPLAAATGRCHPEWMRAVGRTPLPDDAVVLCGARDLDAAETVALAQSGVRGVDAARVRALGAERAGAAVADALGSRERDVYLHVDLDGIDPIDAPAVAYATPGGLLAADVLSIVRAVGEKHRLTAAALAAYDPARDEDERTARLAVRLALALAEAARVRPRP